MPGGPPRKGPRELFAGLWIGGADYGFETHPVLALSMARKSASPERLELDIMGRLAKKARLEGLDIAVSEPGSMLADLIEDMSLKYGKQVVLLVDEYDAPLSQNMGDPDLAEGCRNVLRDLYSNVKDSKDRLRFVLVTGVTRFAMSGLTAGLNNPDDLTLDDKFSGICGFTADELDGCFGEHMEAALPTLKGAGEMPPGSTVDDLRNRILDWYDGYSWDGRTRLLNPWSIVQFFNKAVFSDYWNAGESSGSFLAGVADDDVFSLVNGAFRNMPARMFGPADLRRAEPAPALFQAGYLTVGEISPGPEGRRYTLRIPNREIGQIRDGSFNRLLFSLLRRKPEEVDDEFKGALKELDSGTLTRLFASFFASVPAEHHRNDENCYHNLAHGFLYDARFRQVTSELQGALGNSDLAVYYPDERLCAIIEIKCPRDWKARDKEARRDADGKTRLRLAEDGLRAAREKEYALPFAARADRVVIVGLGVVWRGRCLALAEEGDPAMLRPPGAGSRARRPPGAGSRARGPSGGAAPGGGRQKPGPEG
jgi:hypothetical protein